MSKLSRTKGRAYEQSVARRLRESDISWDARRGWQSDGRLTPDVTCGPLSIECKHRKVINVREALADAVRHTQKGSYSVLCCKWHGGQEAVVMPWDDWLEMAEYWARYRSR